MNTLTMYRDNTQVISAIVAVGGVPINLTGCTVWLTAKNQDSWQTDADPAAFFQLSTTASTVTIGPPGSGWVASSFFSNSTYTFPVAPNGFYYLTEAGGTSGSSEPAFPTVVGATVTDGSVVWTCVGPTAGLVSATITPAMTATLTTDARFICDWKVANSAGVITTLEVFALVVYADVTRTN